MKLLALGLCLSCTLLVSQSGLASEIALPAGTAVSVKLADTIDSDHDPLGKQYSASIAAPVDIGGQKIAAGSPATVVLIHNNSGWLTLLKVLTVNGRKFQVASGAGTLIAPGQGSKASPTSGLLGRIGIAPAAAPISDQRVLLPPATQLRFLLVGTATAAHVVADTPRPRRPARIDASPGLPPAESRAAAPQQESGVAYLCRASDTSDRAVPTAYYVADVFKTSDNPVLVERRWHEFLIATYPYRFANNPHATVQCTRMEDSATDRDARRKLEKQLKSENAEIVETRWHYTLGPPPVPTTSPATSNTQPMPGAAEQPLRPQAP